MDTTSFKRRRTRRRWRSVCSFLGTLWLTSSLRQRSVKTRRKRGILRVVAGVFLSVASFFSPFLRCRRLCPPPPRWRDSCSARSLPLSLFPAFSRLCRNCAGTTAGVHWLTNRKEEQMGECLCVRVCWGCSFTALLLFYLFFLLSRFAPSRPLHCRARYSFTSLHQSLSSSPSFTPPLPPFLSQT